MRNLGLGSLVFLCGLGFAKSSDFTGKFEVDYAGSEARGIFLGEPAKDPVGAELDYSKLEKVEEVPTVEVAEGAEEGKLKLTGAGFKFDRACAVEESGSRANCDTHSGMTGKDPLTGCKVQAAVAEILISSSGKLVAYGKIRLFALEEKNKECEKYQENVLASLKAGKASPFFKAMQQAKVIEAGKPFPDILMLANFYAVTSKGESLPLVPPATDEAKAEDSWSGVYELNYLGRSVTQTWAGKDTTLKAREGRDFDYAEFAKLPKESPLIVMWDAKTGMMVAGAGSQEARKCREVKGAKDLYVCSPLFAANEEEAGTGCSIEHRLYEMLSKDASGKISYSKWERRTFSEQTINGCISYRQKTTDELKAGNAELFWRVMLKTGAIESPEKLGDVGQLGHLYSAKFLFD